jgi:hypothetical protein
MPLNWSVREVKNSDDICYFTAVKTRTFDGVIRGEEYTHPITDNIVWQTMSLGLNEITEGNIDEWEKRLALAYHIDWISKMVVFAGYEDDGNIKWEPRMITRADLVNHIGLNTNASYETAGAWRKRVMERMEEEGLRELRYAEKKNPEQDAITWGEHIALRDAIRSGKITKEEAAKQEVPA